MNTLETLECINSLTRAYDNTGIEYFQNKDSGVLNAKGEGWIMEISYCIEYVKVNFEYWNLMGRGEIRQQLIYFEGLGVVRESVDTYELGKRVFIHYAPIAVGSTKDEKLY